MKLLPCPHCGSADIDPECYGDAGGRIGPQCNDCGATAMNTAAWNRRAPVAPAPDAITAREAELREALEAIAHGDGEATVIAMQTLERYPAALARK